MILGITLMKAQAQEYNLLRDFQKLLRKEIQ